MEKAKVKTPKRVGLIDLGTNSLRIEAYTYHTDSPSDPIRIHREVYMPRIGQDLYTLKRLNPESKTQILEALRKAKSNLDSLEVQTIRAVATSALRESEESEVFLKEIKDSLNIDFEIISGSAEALLTAQGILTFEKNITRDQDILLIDIGGGSTEISKCKNKEIICLASLELGAVRAHRKCICSSPPSENQIKDLHKHINEEIIKIPQSFFETQAKIAIGSSGTVRTFSKMPSFSNKDTITVKEVSKFIEKISKMNIKEISEIEGIDTKRAEVILGGAVILERVLQHFKIKEFQISTYSLRHGLLAKQIQQTAL